MGRLAVALALVLAACGGGQREEERATSPALWEIVGPGGTGGWLFGTVHALPAGLRWETPAMNLALRRADRLVVEITGIGEDPAAGRRLFLHLGTTPGLPPLAARVRSDLRDELARLTERSGTDPAAMVGLEDWAAAMTLAQAVEAKAGFDPRHGVEQALVKRAGSRPVEGLETLAGQLAIFDGLRAEAQRALLEAIVAESAEPEQGARLVELWLHGDTEALARETGKGMLAHPTLRRALLVERNDAWAERIDAILRAGGRPFIAVGAGHVVGAQGLPALLGERGWTVRRVQ